MIQFWTFSKIVNLQTNQSNDDLRTKLEWREAGRREREWTGLYTGSLYKLLYNSSEVAEQSCTRLVCLLNHNSRSTKLQHGMKQL